MCGDRFEEWSGGPIRFLYVTYSKIGREEGKTIANERSTNYQFKFSTRAGFKVKLFCVFLVDLLLLFLCVFVVAFRC